jgi:hypothetical protein
VGTEAGPDQWTNFFTVLTPIAAIIVGFLFVALQVNDIQWGEVPLRHAAAARTLIELAAPLIIGLCALYPGGKWTLGGKIAGFAVLLSVVVFLILYS